MQSYNKIQKAINNLTKKGLNNLFKIDTNRFNNYSLQLGDLLFDYSKNYISQEIIDMFVEDANANNFSVKVQDMFNGENINFTEKRAVLHVALRNPNINPVVVNGINYYQDIWKTFNNYSSFAEKVRNNVINGSTNKKFTDIVNIGIGGSYLPVLAAYRALSDYRDSSINLHFVANIDGTSIKEVLKNINPETTLFVVTSKTFTTKETMINASFAKDWLIHALGDKAVKQHFVAITTNITEAKSFGIQSDKIFGFWDFIGGRFSMWSSVSLPLVIAIGKDNFLDLLEGAKLMDNHFRDSPLNVNIPFIMAILTIIYRNFLNLCSEAIIPYCDYLDKFPLYLQQVVMESNGKTNNVYGERVSLKTSPVIFGEVGTNAQHSFFQMLHQGSDIIPVDFIGIVNSSGDSNHQDILVANLIAQSEALMVGKTKEQVVKDLQNSLLDYKEIMLTAPHKVFEGGRPSNVILFKKLTPKTLGMLYAMYEHKVYSLGIIWKINSFDQYGVELGKQLAENIVLEIQNNEKGLHDSSTSSLIEFYKLNKN